MKFLLNSIVHRLSRHNNILLTALNACVLIIVWDILVGGGWINQIFIPTPYKVLESFISLLTSKEFLVNHFLTSLSRVTISFLLIVSLSFPLSILMTQVKSLRSVIEPLLSFTRYLPVAALVPLCILWFGIDTAQKVAVIVFGVIFQLTLLFNFDFATVPQEFIESANTLGLSRWKIIRKVVLPFAMPALWDDMRISAGWAWSYLVLAELVAGNKGLGYFIINAQRFLEIDKVFAGILFVGVLGALTDYCFRIIADRLFQWK
jgi:NitT/TauT family transport system permease protein